MPEEARSSLSSEFASVSYTMKCTADVMGLMGQNSHSLMLFSRIIDLEILRFLRASFFLSIDTQL